MDQFDLCVYCRRRPVEARFRPFCSERCRLLDLASWAEGSYRIPGEPVDPGESATTDDESEPASQGS